MALGDKALAVLKARKIKPTARWEKVWHEERAKAFMVAQMTRESQLKRVYAMLVKAQQQGMTKKQFVDNLSYFLAKDSWAPKGRGGIPYRLARIFSVNRRVSNAAGRWHRIQETKKALPYLLYSLGPSAKHRDSHVAFNGTLLPVKDPFW